MVKFKSLSIWIFSALLLLVTIMGAMAVEDDRVDLKSVYLKDDLLRIEYEPVISGVGLVVCEVLINDEPYVSNVISTPNKLNRISEDDVFAEGEYLFFMRCMQEDKVAVSGTYLLKFVDDGESSKNVNDEEDKKKGFLNNPGEVFFTLIILVAAFIIIKSLIPKTDKRKNKRLRRFA